MKNNFKLIPVILLIGLFSCKKEKKDPDPTPAPPATTDTLKILFEHTVNDTIEFNFNQKYVSPNLDTFKVTTLKYYISNIVITKTDNTTYAEPNSYHLIDNADYNSTVISVLKVPFATYKSLSFTLGVDSASNCSGAQGGDLDPSKGMFWTWTSGYVMFKLEGTSPQSGSGTKAITYHIGGFGGADKVQRNFSFSFPATPSLVYGGTSPYIHMSVDVNELFKTPNLINMATQFDQVTVGPGAKIYADNYADMFTFEHVHN